MSQRRSTNAELYPTDPAERDMLYLNSIKQTLAELQTARAVTLCVDDAESLDKEIRKTVFARNAVMARISRARGGSR
jgi:hypothetical protein